MDGRVSQLSLRKRWKSSNTVRKIRLENAIQRRPIPGLVARGRAQRFVDHRNPVCAEGLCHRAAVSLVVKIRFELPGPLRGRPRIRENRVRSLAEVGVSWRSEPVFEFDPGSRWWGCALLP